MNDFYKINSRMDDGEAVLFDVSLLPEYRVYTGHFPGNPVSPGVCSIQMIKECAEQLSGRRLFLAYLAKCRFSTVITPKTTPRLWLRMYLSEDGFEMYSIKATLFDDTATYIEFKGEFACRGGLHAPNEKLKTEN